MLTEAMRPSWYKTFDPDTRRGFWTTFFGFTIDAMDVQLYAFILPALVAIWHLGNDQAGLLVTVTLVCSALGGIVAGQLADKYGRAQVLKITILWLAITTVLCAFAQDFRQLLVARALQGIGFGAEWAVGAVFIAEIARPESRGQIVGAAQSAWPTGWALAAISSTTMFAFWPAELAWRLTFLVGLWPALAVFLVRLRLKESPAYLASTHRSPFHEIFNRTYLSATLRGSLLAVGMHGGYWAVATWWPAMLHLERGFSAGQTSIYFGALIGGSFVGYGFGAWFGDKIGRKRTLGGFAVGAILLVLTCTRLGVSDVALLVLSVPLGFFSLGMFSLIGVILAELYPTPLRGSGLGFCYNLGRGIAGVTPLVIGGSVTGMQISHAMGLYASIAFAIVLLAAALLPDRPARSFAEPVQTS
jgi:MFS family permease